MSERVSEHDHVCMRAALAEGENGRPSPNPHVGAAVVQGGEVVAVGHHARVGEDHAEVVALSRAGERARGGTLYVTLEPCNHVGRTPPCTDAIVRAGIRRVVIGSLDPNPHVKGGGADTLRAHGIAVAVGACSEQANALVEPWRKFVTTGIPFVSLKLALSLDGRIATRTGESKWVTGEAARQRVQVLRRMEDAVAIGIGTALADNPRLTVRDIEGPSPLRVVFDTRLRLPVDSELACTAHEVPTWVFAGPDAPEGNEAALRALGVEVFRVPTSVEGRTDPEAVLRTLSSRGVVRMMVEGGAELSGSLLAGRFVDRLHAFLAPILLGPRGRPGAVDWAGPSRMDSAPRLRAPQWEVCGSDAHVFGDLLYPDE